jgi:hypothetical protein
MKTMSLSFALLAIASSAFAQHAGHHHAMALPPYVVVAHRLSPPLADAAAPKVAPVIDPAKPLTAPTDTAISVAAMLMGR